MIEIAYYGIRAWLLVKSILCCCYSPVRRNRTVSTPTSTIVHYPKFSIETLSFLNGDRKHRIHPPGESTRGIVETMNTNVRPPWFFIGFYDSAKSLQDNTSQLAEYIYPGNVITLDVLKHLYPGSQRWVYIHPETFEETEFPPEGIVIE